MAVVGTCEFCGSSQKSEIDHCESCGANIAYSEENQLTAEVLAQTITPVLKDSRKSRIYLTGTTILFAALFGVFWQKSQIADQRSGTSQESVTLTSMVGSGGGYHKKAKLASAMADISILKIMVNEYTQRHVEFPDTMADLGVNAEEMVSKYIRKISIEGKGVVSALLSEDFGNEMQIELVPEMIMGGRRMQWSCASNLPSYILVGSACEAMIGPGGKYNKYAMMTSVISEIFIVRDMVYEYFAEYDKLPNSMADLGVNADEMFSHSIRKISIRAEGVISVLLVEGFGTEMQLKLIPELAMGSWGARVIKWRCTSNLPAPVLVGSSCEAI